MTPAERRRERLRLHIIEVADRLYHENGGDETGFENTTIEAVAQQSDISLRTFFRYFNSKADVIYLDVPTSVVHLRQRVLERLGKEPVASALFNARLDQFRWITSNKVGRERLLRALRAPQFRERLMVMRSEVRAALTEIVLPYMPGEGLIQLQHAKTLSLAYAELFGDGYDLWATDQSVDIAAYVRECLALLSHVNDAVTQLPDAAQEPAPRPKASGTRRRVAA